MLNYQSLSVTARDQWWNHSQNSHEKYKPKSQDWMSYFMDITLPNLTKRALDYSLALITLVMFSPILATIALMIKREGDGPIFYRGERIGKSGIPFRIFKFRTMVSNAEKIGGPSTPKDDPRITPLGRRLRRHKLDELPQFFNVLKGEMSIVGPRPEVKYYTDMFTEEEKAILSVQPGITDWASIWNSDEGAVLAGAKDPEKVYFELIRPTKLKLQLKYVKEKSLKTDLKIIFLSLREMFRSRKLAIEFFNNNNISIPDLIVGSMTTITCEDKGKNLGGPRGNIEE